MRHTLLAVVMAAVALAGLPLAAAQQQPAEDGRFRDQIEVGRIITEVRVVDRAGRPVPGLTAADFTVTVGGAAAEVEAVDWVASSSPQPPPLTTPDLTPQPLELLRQAADPRAGRLLVFVFQSDLQFASVRVSGLIRMSYYAIEFLEELGPEDRVALLVFGSHLELHSDFTNDYDYLVTLLGVPDLLESYQSSEQRSSPSLVEHFDVEAAWDAATISQGLTVLAEALQPISGPKSVILFGWGIGRYGSTGVWLGADFSRARYAFAKARTSVFSLDITTADYHTLEVGLEAMAEATGGFYAKTHLFPQQAVSKLARVISGYYELSIVKPADLAGYQPVSIEVPGCRGAQVLARPIIALEDGEPTSG